MLNDWIAASCKLLNLDALKALYVLQALHPLKAFAFRGLGDAPIMGRFDLLDIAP